MAALLSYCGWIVAAWDGILWSLACGAILFVLVRRIPPDLMLQAIGARPVARWEAPMLYEILEALCRRARLNRIPHLCWVAQRLPVAFTIGQGEVATIALSKGLASDMTAREIGGILAHEIVHIRNGDLALMQLAMVVGQLTRTVSQIAFLLVFFNLFLRTISIPSLPIVPLLVLALAPLAVGLMQLSLSRAREGEADLTHIAWRLRSSRCATGSGCCCAGGFRASRHCGCRPCFATTRQPKSAFELSWRCRSRAIQSPRTMV